MIGGGSKVRVGMKEAKLELRGNGRRRKQS